MITPNEFIEKLGLQSIADDFNNHPKSGSDWSIRSLIEKYDYLLDKKNLAITIVNTINERYNLKLKTVDSAAMTEDVFNLLSGNQLSDI